MSVLSASEAFEVAETGEPAAGRGTSSTSKKRCVYEQYVQPCLVELFATAMFVFVGCASVIGSVGIAGAVQPALAHGLALGVLIMVFGKISGGHFNPAVSLSVYLCGGMKLILLVPYVLAQISGGMIGAGLARVRKSNSTKKRIKKHSELAKCMLGEVMMTLIVTMVVCMGAVNSQTSTPGAAFCIGLIVSANIFAGGLTSGACMNPARAFGPAVVANHWSHHWIYWVGPLCGALLTVSFIRYCVVLRTRG
uniref:Aquaporin 8a, tandem duplicate 1 n=1 Tax=Anabas testudineus TaxID=64144 RepID=A0A7N5ZUD4_ANATE